MIWKSLLFLAYVSLFCFLISRSKRFKALNISVWVFLLMFLIRVLAGGAMTALYTWYYPVETSDIHKLFNDGLIIYHELFSHPLRYIQLITGLYRDDMSVTLSQMHWWFKPIYINNYNETRALIRLNAVFDVFSAGFLPINMLFMAMISLTGSFFWYLVGLKHLKVNPLASFVTSFFLPSILLWTSTVLKEGIIFTLLGVFFYYAFESFKRKPSSIVLLIVLLLLLTLVKPFLSAFIIISGLGYIIYRKYSIVKASITVVLLNLFFLLGIPMLKLINPSWDAIHDLCYKRGEYIYLAERLPAPSLIFHNYLPFTYSSVFHELPNALTAVILRPFPFEILSPLYILPALENMAISLLLLLWLFRVLKRKADVVTPDLLFMNLFFLNAILIGLTIPVLGSIVRYKAPFLLLLIFPLLRSVRTPPSFVFISTFVFKSPVNEESFSQEIS